VAHPSDAERLWQNPGRMPYYMGLVSAGQTAEALKQAFAVWSEATRRVVHPTFRTFLCDLRHCCIPGGGP
jgi:hypothetical protein